MFYINVLHTKNIHDRSCNKTNNSVPRIIQRVELHILQHVGCYTLYTDMYVSFHNVSPCIILIKCVDRSRDNIHAYIFIIGIYVSLSQYTNAKTLVKNGTPLILVSRVSNNQP